MYMNPLYFLQITSFGKVWNSSNYHLHPACNQNWNVEQWHCRGGLPHILKWTSLTTLFWFRWWLPTMHAVRLICFVCFFSVTLRASQIILELYNTIQKLDLHVTFSLTCLYGLKQFVIKSKELHNMEKAFGLKIIAFVSWIPKVISVTMTQLH